VTTHKYPLCRGRRALSGASLSQLTQHRWGVSFTTAAAGVGAEM
jgi:hypothetical protein